MCLAACGPDKALAGVDSESMEWMAGVSAEDHRQGLSRARLLAGAIWHASVVLIDQLFQDIHTLHEKDSITREDTDDTWILSGLPPSPSAMLPIGLSASAWG